MIPQDTICAPATPAGGALSIIRVSGPQAIEYTSRIFSKDLMEAKSHTIHFGYISQEIDEVMVAVFKAPNSYTGENSTEIYCHGSQYIVNQILLLLMQEGARMAEPGEYTQRAFLNGKLDLTQAEAVADLIASHDQYSHHIAINKLRGGFSTELRQLRDKLLQLTSLLELEMDFSEEDVEFASRSGLLSLCQEIETHIDKLARSYQIGNAIKNGIAVAIIGAPNVGKSTLLNLLLHEDKAIVSDIQGTTRDTIEDTVSFHGITFRFIDTAGIRETTDKVELMGIERSIEAAKRAKIVILLTQPFTEFPTIPKVEGQHVIKVVNKCDTIPQDQPYPMEDDTIFISALKHIGIEDLYNQLVKIIDSYHIDDSQTIVTSLRHYQLLTLALSSIQTVQEGLMTGLTLDLVASDLHECLRHLSSIIGDEISSEAVLKNIFKNFCIGK